MNKGLRAAERLGILDVDDLDWKFRVYLMRGDCSETIDRDRLLENLTRKVRRITGEFLSTEFQYIRSGFVIAHYGRRGVTYSFWHWADWEGTWEYFCQAWYCYGRAIDQMEPLDRSEPLLCQHEIDLVGAEAVSFREIVMSSTNIEEVRRRYRTAEPLDGKEGGDKALIGGSACVEAKD